MAVGEGSPSAANSASAPQPIRYLHLVAPNPFDFQPTLRLLAGISQTEEEEEPTVWHEKVCAALKQLTAAEASGPSSATQRSLLQTASVFFEESIPGNERGVEAKRTHSRLAAAGCGFDDRVSKCGMTTAGGDVHQGYAAWIQALLLQNDK